MKGASGRGQKDYFFFLFSVDVDSCPLIVLNRGVLFDCHVL